MILYRASPKDYQKMLELMRKLSHVAGDKINTQKCVAFLYTNNKLSESKSKKNLIYNCIKMNKIPRNKFNQGGERPIL